MQLETENEKVSGKVFPLASDKDLVKVRDYGRNLAAKIGFSSNTQTLIATAISEICRNVVEYAGKGEVTIGTNSENEECIKIKVADDGPGIKDLNKALQEGYSSGKGLGVGLPGAKRIMDEFEIQTEPGKGTTVIMCKKLNNDNGF